MFPLTTTDSKHDFTNSNERKHSYVWNLMHNSVQRFCKIDSFQNVFCTYNVWKKILMSSCSPSVKFNTHTKKASIPSWLRRLHQPSRGNDQVISWLAFFEIIHIWTHFKQWWHHTKGSLSGVTKRKTEDALLREVSYEFRTLGTTTTLNAWVTLHLFDLGQSILRINCTTSV